MDEIILETRDIIKDFPGVRALDHVSIRVPENKILGLCGENGAGKSTLINVLSGVYPHGSYQGEIYYRGEKQQFNSITEAENRGIAVIPQELSMFNELSVAENLFMGHEIADSGIINWNAIYSETYRWLEKLKINNVTPTTKIRKLGIARQQLIEIAKALRKESELLILDEPTSSLTDSEIEILFDLLVDLKDEGVTCIFISHKLNEIFQIADYISVLRDGQSVGGGKASELNERDVIKMMVGREITQMFPKKKSEPGDKEVLRVENFNVENPQGGYLVKEATFSLKQGEILGIFGLVGAGRTELVNSIFGLSPGRPSGDIYLHGNKLDIDSPKKALDNGIALVSEDRQRFGLIPSMDVRENTSIAFIEKFRDFLQINENKEIVEVRNLVDQLNIKTPSLETQVIYLSGGNQQKVVVAKNLITETDVLIMDEPTRGIDVGAKQEMYNLIKELSENGVSIIMVSSELPEILGMSDRILVLYEGEITGRFDNRNKDNSQEDLMIPATGGKSNG